MASCVAISLLAVGILTGSFTVGALTVGCFLIRKSVEKSIHRAIIADAPFQVFADRMLGPMENIPEAVSDKMTRGHLGLDKGIDLEWKAINHKVPNVVNFSFIFSFLQ